MIPSTISEALRVTNLLGGVIPVGGIQPILGRPPTMAHGQRLIPSRIEQPVVQRVVNVISPPVGRSLLVPINNWRAPNQMITAQVPRMSVVPGVPVHTRPMPPLQAAPSTPPVSNIVGTPQTPPLTNSRQSTSNTSTKSDQKNGQILTLPAAVAKRLNLHQHLSIKINNMSITVPPSSLLATKDGLKLFLPPNTFPVSLGETAKLSVTVTNDKNTSAQPQISINMLSDTAKKPSKPAESPKQKESPSNHVNNKLGNSETAVTNPKRQRRFKSGINPSACFIQRLYGGFDCMFCIFHYLSQRDLLR